MHSWEKSKSVQNYMEEILNVWAENIQRQVKECSAESYEKDIKSLGNCLRAEKAQ